MNVTVKGFPVRYGTKTYQPGEALTIKDAEYNENLFASEIIEGKVNEDEKNLYLLDTAQLEKLKKDDLAKFLKDEQVEFAADAKKEDLIKLITGE